MPRTRTTGPASATAVEQTPAASRQYDELSRIVPRMDKIIGYKLRRAQLSVFQDFLLAFAKIKLRPAEFSVLAMIADTPGQKQTEIASQLGIKRANFVALMDGLERRGLAERRKTEADKRSHSLHLTPEGVRFMKKVMVLWREHEEHLIARLGGPAERDRLIALLDRILAPDT
ncbi:Transcriptional repressor MprA [Rhizobiaceae bacterium]|nr:Transcriptional repressor MprA [Rhizobiaceae bacterium]